MSTALAKSDTPTQDEWTIMNNLAETMLKSGFLPVSIKTKEQAVAIALKGRELGVPFIQAISGINIIQGKPTVSSELMLGLIFKNCPGAKIQYVQNDNKGCAIRAARPGQPPSTFSFTMDDASLAGVLSKDNWRKFPAAMLRARCISAMARALFPDAIMGCSYTPEELGAVVDDDGEVIEMPPEEAPKPRIAQTRADTALQIAQDIEKTKTTPKPVPEKSDDPGQYQKNFGTKDLGKRVCEIPRSELVRFLEWADNLDRPMTAIQKDYYDAVSAFLMRDDPLNKMKV